MFVRKYTTLVFIRIHVRIFYQKVIISRLFEHSRTGFRRTFMLKWIQLVTLKEDFSMALHVMDEANRCLGCKVPQCRKGCPISTPIPDVIRLLKDNKLDEAGRILFENNPLTVSSATTKISVRDTVFSDEKAHRFISPQLKAIFRVPMHQR